MVAKQFWELVNLARAVHEEDWQQDSEPYFEQLLEFVNANPSARNDFAKLFFEGLDGPEYIPIDLMEYCMHELRWPEVQQGVEGRLQDSPSERSRYLLSRLLSAFDDDWDTADLYDRYSS